MKKFISIIMLIISISLLTACKSTKEIDINKLKKSNYDISKQSMNVTLSVKEGVIDTKSESITLVYTNISDKEYTFGKEPHLEVKANKEWYVVKTLENVGWDDIGYILAKKNICEEVLPLKDYYGSLNVGNYRIIKTLYSNGEPIYSFAEFKIED